VEVEQLGTQQFVPEPVAVFEEHQPQMGFHRHARPAIRAPKNGANGAKNRSLSNQANDNEVGQPRRNQPRRST
jgi:hypothetical protein